MTYTDLEVRELVSLAIVLSQGDYPEGAHERFAQLTGMSIGTARHACQHEHLFLFAVDPSSGEVVDRRHVGDAFPAHERIFAEFAARNPAAACEMWGAYHDWSPGKGMSCLSSVRRSDGLAVGDIAQRVLDEHLRADAEFEPNEYQRAVIATYGDGDYAHLSEIKGRTEFYRAVEEVGDTLFRFAIVELDDSEGVDGPDDAVRRMEIASDDMKQAAESVARSNAATPKA